MSVLVCNRRESRLEVLVGADKLHSELRDLMLRNFGMNSDKIALRKYLAYGKTPEENLNRVLFLIEGFKRRIDQKASLVTDYLTSANAIYPHTIAEYETRRQNQTYAICLCKEITKELQNVIDTFDVDLNAYDRYVTAVKKEIKLIKKWRQKDNRYKDILQNRASAV